LRWIDYNFFGSQLVTHFANPEYVPVTHVIDKIPVPSFGADLTAQEYQETR
jgi:extradiol dioxygenase family protein